MAKRLYYIRSQKHDQNNARGNEIALWWCPNSQGYTFDLTKAGKYTEAQALDICGPFGVPTKSTGRGRNAYTTPEEIAYPVEMVDQTAILMVNKYAIENRRYLAIKDAKVKVPA